MNNISYKKYMKYKKLLRKIKIKINKFKLNILLSNSK